MDLLQLRHMRSDKSTSKGSWPLRREVAVTVTTKASAGTTRWPGWIWDVECAGRISLEIQQLSTPREVGMTPETKLFPFFLMIYSWNETQRICQTCKWWCDHFSGPVTDESKAIWSYVALLNKKLWRWGRSIGSESVRNPFLQLCSLPVSGRPMEYWTCPRRVRCKIRESKV